VPKGIIRVDDVELNILASSIKKVAEAAEKMRSSRLTEKALLILLSHHSGPGQREVKQVLDAAADLGHFLKKAPIGGSDDEEELDAPRKTRRSKRR